MSNPIDLLGKKIKNFTVIKKLPSRLLNCGTLRTFWLVRCDCGNEIEVLTKHIRDGTFKRCNLCRPSKRFYP